MSQRILSDYQIAAIGWMASKKHALLAFVMGLGKTAVAICACDSVDAKSILVICPAIARYNWQREFAMWSIYDREFTVCLNHKDQPTKFTIVSYEYATTYLYRLVSKQWDVVINDEAHLIKEPEAKRTRAIYGKSGIVRKTTRMWNLTGTPAPNNASELWAMLYTFGITGLSYDFFVERYCTTRPTFYNGKRGTQVTGTKSQYVDELKGMLSQIMLRKTLADVSLQLPACSFSEYVVEPGSLPADFGIEKAQTECHALEEAIAYCSTDEQYLDVFAAMPNSVATLRRMTGLLKVKPVAEMVKTELSQNEYDKIIIFAVHQEVVESLHRELAEFGAVVIYGKTPAKQRQENIDRFQGQQDCRVFIGNIAAAGTAITLTSANQVLFIEQSWTPADNAQAVCRAHRRGQERPVFVRCIGIADSIDEKITSVLRRKTQDLAMIFDKEKTHGN
jgi:SNF2 family DNA or RNA helicase